MSGLVNCATMCPLTEWTQFQCHKFCTEVIRKLKEIKHILYKWHQNIERNCLLLLIQVINFIIQNQLTYINEMHD